MSSRYRVILSSPQSEAEMNTVMKSRRSIGIDYLDWFCLHSVKCSRTFSVCLFIVHMGVSHGFLLGIWATTKICSTSFLSFKYPISIYRYGNGFAVLGNIPTPIDSILSLFIRRSRVLVLHSRNRSLTLKLPFFCVTQSHRPMNERLNRGVVK